MFLSSSSLSPSEEDDSLYSVPGAGLAGPTVSLDALEVLAISLNYPISLRCLSTREYTSKSTFLLES